MSERKRYGEEWQSYSVRSDGSSHGIGPRGEVIEKDPPGTFRDESDRLANAIVLAFIDPEVPDRDREALLDELDGVTPAPKRVRRNLDRMLNQLSAKGSIPSDLEQDIRLRARVGSR